MTYLFRFSLEVVVVVVTVDVVVTLSHQYSVLALSSERCRIALVYPQSQVTKWYLKYKENGRMNTFVCFYLLFF